MSTVNRPVGTPFGNPGHNIRVNETITGIQEIYSSFIAGTRTEIFLLNNNFDLKIL